MNNRTNKKLIVNFLVIFLFSIFYFLLSVPSAHAADLYFSPAVGTYKAGDNYVVDVFVNSDDQAINAISSEISFPVENLEITGLNKDSSILNFWLHEPTFSNKTGKINFEGVIFNPGFKGLGGKILTIRLKIKAVGRAKLIFSSSYVLANDGKGTNILDDLGESNFNFINSKISAESSTPSIIIDTPLAAEITSPTHTDPNKWYANKNPKFNWSTPTGTMAVRFAYDKNPTGLLDKALSYKEIISVKEFKGLADGVWYFHLQFKNDKGWGAVSHFRFRIDTQSPEQFFIEQVNSTKDSCPTIPNPSFKFSTKDNLSGIEYYEIKVDDANVEIFSSEELTKNNNIYSLKVQKPGDHLLTVKAVDQAGNYSLALKKFCINALPAPIFTSYPNKINPNENIVIQGKAINDGMVKIYVQNENNPVTEETVKINKDGVFTYVSSKNMGKGLFTFWAEAIDMNGALSNLSDKISLMADDPWLVKVGNGLINYLSIIVVVLSLLMIILLLIFHFTSRMRYLRKRVNAEVKEAEVTNQKVFNFLKEEIEAQVSKFDGEVGLSEREQEVARCLKRSLSISEEMLSKEIKDIEKEVK